MGPPVHHAVAYGVGKRHVPVVRRSKCRVASPLYTDEVVHVGLPQGLEVQLLHILR